MSPKRTFTASRVAIVVTLALGVAACGSDGADDDATPADGVAARHAAAYDAQCGHAVSFERPPIELVTEGDGTLTIEGADEEIVVPKAPRAALGMYTVDVDILLALGFPLNERLPIDGRNKTWPCFFPHDELASIETFDNYPEYNYEEIAAAKPDFILNGLGHDEAIGGKLAAIAPTLDVEHFDGQPWTGHFKETARLLGRSAQAEAWETFYRKRLEEVRGEIEEAVDGDLSDVVVAMLDNWDTAVQVTCSYDVECSVFRDLGLTVHPLALHDGLAGTPLSVEQLEQLNELDHAFVPAGFDESGTKLAAGMLVGLEGNPLWPQLPFVEDGHVHLYEYAMTYGGPSAQLAFLETVRRAFSAE